MQAPMAERTGVYSTSRDEDQVPLGSGTQGGSWAHCESFLGPGLGTVTSLLLDERKTKSCLDSLK